MHDVAQFIIDIRNKMFYFFAMTRVDARKLSRKDLLTKRQQVIHLFNNKMPVMEIVENTGLSWPAVNAAIKLYKADGKTALMPEKRGRKQGTDRALSKEQELELCRILFRSRPWQLGIKLPAPQYKLTLWNRNAVRLLIELQYGLKLSERCISKYLERWGFPLMKPKQRPRERCSNIVNKWLPENYEMIERLAKTEYAEIYWISIKTVDSKQTMGIANQNQLCIKCKRPHKILMLSAINNRGKEQWQIVSGKFTQKKQTKFLQAIINESRKRVILIRDDFKYYTEKQVVEWLCLNARKIKLFPSKDESSTKGKRGRPSLCQSIEFSISFTS